MKKMITNRGVLSLMILVVFSLLLTACGQRDLQVPDTGEDGVISTSDLLASLRDAGVSVEEGGAINQPFFDVPGQLVRLNGADVQIFEFADPTAREAAASTIAPDAATIGEFIPNWVDQANFWAGGNLIALYVGRDDALKKLMTNLMGSPLASSSQVEGSLQGDQAAFEAQRQLAQRFSAAAEDVTIKAVEAVEWSDSCLGVIGDGMSCTQVVTPGWRVTLSFDNRDFEARTNQNATVVRFPALP